MSWKEICFPKSEGGLGIKDIESWNNACILQNIWAIISKAGSIWIAWLNECLERKKHMADSFLSQLWMELEEITEAETNWF